MKIEIVPLKVILSNLVSPAKYLAESLRQLLRLNAEFLMANGRVNILGLFIDLNKIMARERLHGFVLLKHAL